MFGKILIDRSYKVGSELGAGGTGAVYKAWHKRLQKHVVVKENKSSSKRDIEAGRNETEALKNVKCVHLPQVFDFLKKGKHSYTVLEYIEGESFDKLLDRGERFTCSQTLKWYGQLSAALATLHKQDICHRDIKPANIMLTPDGDVCLIDFNAALVKGSNTRITSRSLGYASPEQLAIFDLLGSSRFDRTGNDNMYDGAASRDVGAAPHYSAETQLLSYDSKTELVDCNSKRQGLTTVQADGGSSVAQISGVPTTTGTYPLDGIDWKRSDIYSLGVTMRHILTGIHPSEQVAEGSPLLLSENLCKGVAMIIEKSTRYDPAERFASATALSETIEQAARRHIDKHK